MGVILTRQAIVRAAVEAAEGVEQSLAGAPATLAYDVAFDPDAATFTREPSRGTLSKLPSTRGAKTATLSMRGEVKGSGVKGQVPDWDVFLRACGFQVSDANSAVAGAVTAGPFIAGERINNGAGGEGIVLAPVKDGDAAFPFIITAGALVASDVVTGESSGASMTLGVVTAGEGVSYRPLSSGVPSLTIGFYNDGILHTMVGCRGTVTIDCVAGEPVFFSFNFQGVWLSDTDEPMPTDVTFDETVPPTFLDVGLDFDGDNPCFTALGIDMGNVLENRTCANSPNGVKSTMLTGRSPSASIDPELDLVANFDPWTDLRTGDEGSMFAQWGDEVANTILLALPLTQVDDIGPGDRNGIAIGAITLNLATAGVDLGDDELSLTIL